MRVLVAEDDRLVRDLLGEHLILFGHQPTLSPDGRSALEAYKAQPFPIVIADWYMPDLSGGELTRAIRQEMKGAQTFFFIVTVRQGKRAYLEAMDAGVDDFLSKPLDMELLGARIRLAERWLSLSLEVTQLRGLLPICAYCKNIREPSGGWSTVEEYMERHSQAQFSHGICPTCMERVVRPELEALRQRSKP